jgi:hypothetical protein
VHSSDVLYVCECVAGSCIFKAFLLLRVSRSVVHPYFLITNTDSEIDRFPSQGRFCQFPEKNTFWQWTTDQLNSSLEALTRKTLLLEPFDDAGTESNRISPELRIAGSNPSVFLGSPEPSPVEAAEPSAQTRLKNAAEHSGLDDLVIQLTDRAREWREMSQELKRSKQREEDLRATNVEQTTRIDELEKTISENATAASENHQDPNLKSGMEYILGELGRIKAENEELKATIKKHEDEARDSTYTFDSFHSNKRLESCGTFEVFYLRISLQL